MVCLYLGTHLPKGPKHTFERRKSNGKAFAPGSKGWTALWDEKSKKKKPRPTIGLSSAPDKKD